MIMNLQPVLKEILDALQHLQQSGEPHFIYTNKMPFSQEDIEVLATIFQRGDVEIVDNTTNNKAVVYNTAYPGVWIATLWGRTLEFTPILEILEVNWYPQAMAFPAEDCQTGFQQLLEAVGTTPQLASSVRQTLATGQTQVAEGQEVRWELQGPLEDLLHYVLVPGSITLTSPQVTFQATQFWGVWLGKWANGRRELVVSGFPQVLAATPEAVQQAHERLQLKFREIQLTFPLQGSSGN